METGNSPDVFAYRNYRQFLRDYYDWRKKSEYGFSYRRFARAAGFGSPNYLKLVADGARNLTSEMAARFASACGLSGEAAGFFCDLVAFNQADGRADRERCHQRLRAYRRHREVYTLDEAHAAYHAKWYVPAIRELSLCPDFQAEPKWIAKALRPAITAREAGRALKVLRELGMLREEQGRLVPCEPLVTTGEGPLGHHVADFHHAMLERAKHALDHFKTEERGFGALTLAVSAERLPELKRQLYDFRQQLLQESAERGDAVDMVVEINFQLFPLSHPLKPRGDRNDE